MPSECDMVSFALVSCYARKKHAELCGGNFSIADDGSCVQNNQSCASTCQRFQETSAIICPRGAGVAKSFRSKSPDCPRRAVAREKRDARRGEGLFVAIGYERSFAEAARLLRR